jgi:hypothetical protein
MTAGVVIDESALFEETDETPGEREAREFTDRQYTDFSRVFLDDLLDKLLRMMDEFSGIPLYPYQKPFARRVLESLVTNDGATLTGLMSRQSGKTETITDCIVVAMIMLPRLAKIYPELLGKFADGLWVGTFAPTDGQTDIIYGRIIARLSSDRAVEFLRDPEIADRLVKVPGKVPTYKLKNCGSLVSRQTAHPRAKIEGRTYHVILLDEAQDADDRTVNKSIAPMAAATNGTMIYIGTPTYWKGIFYRQIQANKRNATRRGAKTDHYEADWREVAKWNKNYERYIKKEMLRIGEDSDEFRLSYRLHWLLDKGMFTTEDILDRLGDTSMETIPAWHKTPVVVGIDPARKQDSTIVTVVWVDWDRVNDFGFYHHRILNWLDLEGMDWEVQYYRIVEFLANYSIFAIGVDEGGLGDVVISRLRTLMPHVDIIPVGSSPPEQSKRWKHLMQLFAQGQFGFPMHAKTRRLKVYKRFRQQFEDLELHYQGPHILANAPDEQGAHDDYPDSAAIACVMTEDYSAPVAEQATNPFYSESRVNG